MRLLYIVLFCCCISATTNAQINEALKQQLDTILFRDQQYRQFTILTAHAADSVAAIFHVNPDSLAYNMIRLQMPLDSENVVAIEAIFKQYGYPGKSMVGIPTNEAAYYVIQHCNEKIKTYFPLIEEAGKKGELSFSLVAMMQDRMLVDDKKKQKYGTQAVGFFQPDAKTGKPGMYWYIWPIENPARVNELRKKAGMLQTVEEYAREMNAVYLPYMTISDIRKLVRSSQSK
ncbi:DUF6624 domain-containing protein [Chitinophagaceae bacterium MMS25-I14]